jgi:hypothetical protein
MCATKLSQLFSTVNAPPSAAIPKDAAIFLLIDNKISLVANDCFMNRVGEWGQQFRIYVRSNPLSCGESLH